MKVFKQFAILASFVLIASACGTENSDQSKQEASTVKGGVLSSWCVGNTIHYFNSTRTTPCGSRMCREFRTPAASYARCTGRPF